jgi:DNA-binding LacI/PurR family transcriptional regulator
MVTIRDVAREANVASSTVSYAFNGKAVLREATRKRIMDAAKKLGYLPRPARGQPTTISTTSVIAFLLPGGPGELPQDYHYVAESLRGATDVAQDFGFIVTILYQKVKNPHFGFVTLCKTRKIQGIMIFGPKARDPEVEDLVTERFPVVTILGHPSASGIMNVGIDNEEGAFRATEHLIILGHSRIAILLPGSTEVYFSADRYEGYKRALETYHIPHDAALVRNGELSPDVAEEAMGSLLGLPQRPTAVFAGNDTQAMGAMRAARRRGFRVPEDLAVVGFDDIAVSRLSAPGLTTIHSSDYKIAAEATRMLIRKIRRPEIQPETIMLPVELVIRESCGVRSTPRATPESAGE